jgi:hypothetical protein
MRKLLVITALILSIVPVDACTIFIVTRGNRVIVGNHEDWASRDARVRFLPATGSQLGAVVFDFESEGLIQGGVNSAGLFFDATATPFVPLDFTGKQKYEGKDFWLDLLQHCKTIREALDWIGKYQVPELEKVHLFFADRTGQSVIVGAYEGQLTYTWKNQPYQVLTNFNILDPEYGGEQPCPRFAAATKILTPADADPMVAAKTALEQTTQGKLSVYSTLFDLTNMTVQVFYEADFSKSVMYDIPKELKKGGHNYLLSKSIH